MKNNKGQALIEFVLILPIFLVILFLIIDFGMIFSAKTKLESTTSSIISYFSEGFSKEEVEDMYKDYEITILDNLGHKEIKITSKVDLITPMITLFIEDPYPISTVRYILND